MCSIQSCEEPTNDERGLCEHHLDICNTIIWAFNNTSMPEMLFEYISQRMLPEITKAVQASIGEIGGEPQHSGNGLWVPNR